VACVLANLAMDSRTSPQVAMISDRGLPTPSTAAPVSLCCRSLPMDLLGTFIVHNGLQLIIISRGL
jgi:hypothetical protein